MQNIKAITHLFPETLMICYFKALRVCPGMGDNTQLKCHDQFLALMNVYLHGKY